MIAIIGILCLLLVWQILKIILKKGIINKNITDYTLEYIVSITILIALFMQESISRNSLFIIALLGIIYEIISLIYMYFRYYKKETITDFSIKKVIDECEFGILVLKGKRAKLINNKMYEILDKLNIKKDYITNIIKQSIDQLDKNYCVKVEDKYYVFVINNNEIITFDITEVYKLHQKLNEQNKKLKENNKKILLSIDNIEELEKEKNLLKLKNKYHDILGQNLSILQQYLNKENITQENFEEIKSFDNIKQGNDFGYATDPMAFVRIHYDSKKRMLYFIDEIYGVKMPIRELASKIKLKKYDDFSVTCDASEPRSIAELREYGIKATRAKKGPGSVEFGENWLDDLEAIVIDSKRTPNTAREFENIDYQTDRDGNTISKLEDKDNHSIDATRYALENEMKVKSNIQVFK